MIRRIATSRSGGNALEIYLVDGRQFALSQALARTISEATIEAAVQSFEATIQIHAHFNRDDSLAVAVGDTPEAWPEDNPFG